MVLTDGAHHEVDSSEWAFYQASQFAMSDCSDDGTWQILEPIMKVEVTGPEEFQVRRKWGATQGHYKLAHLKQIIIFLLLYYREHAYRLYRNEKD